jgi:hypothetical protein
VGNEVKVDEEETVAVSLPPSPWILFVVGVTELEDETIALNVPLLDRETKPEAPLERVADTVAVEKRDAPEVPVRVGAERAEVSELWLAVPVLTAVPATLPLAMPDNVAAPDTLGEELGIEAPVLEGVAEGSSDRVGKNVACVDPEGDDVGDAR